MRETVQVMSGDRCVTEIRGVSGRLYKAKDGRFTMTPADAWAAQKGAECFVPNVGTGAGAPGGYTCPNGHHNYFRTCGRCGDAADGQES